MTAITTAAGPRAEQCRYDPAPVAPRQARRFVDDVMTRWDWEGSRASVALLTSELVADALRQSPTSIGVQLELVDRTVHVEVSGDPGLMSDASTGRFERRVARSLVESLASSWGSDFDRTRTTTWFSMPADDPDLNSS